MFFVANITTDFLIKNKHFRRLIDFEEHDIRYISVFYSKKSKNIKMLLDFKYFKFNFSSELKMAQKLLRFLSEM